MKQMNRMDQCMNFKQVKATLTQKLLNYGDLSTKTQKSIQKFQAEKAAQTLLL